MSYIGNAPPKLAQYGVESFNGGGTSFTLSKPATTATVLVFIDGVRQTPGDAYSVSGTTLTTTATTPSGTDNVTVQFLGDVVDFGEPSDDSVTSAKIVDGTIVNADINASAAIALSKLASDPSNASNLASGTVPTARLGSGTASSSTFLRGDQSWATAGDDNTPSFQMTRTLDQTFSAGSYGTLDFNQTDWDTDSGCDLTNNKYVVPSGKGGKYLIYGYFQPSSLSGSSVYLRIKVNTTELGLWNASSGNSGSHRWHPMIVYNLSAGDEIIWQLYVDNVSTTTGSQSGGGFRLAGV